MHSSEEMDANYGDDTDNYDGKTSWSPPGLPFMLQPHVRIDEETSKIISTRIIVHDDIALIIGITRHSSRPHGNLEDILREDHKRGR
jgi:hypothetical protein